MLLYYFYEKNVKVAIKFSDHKKSVKVNRRSRSPCSLCLVARFARSAWLLALLALCAMREEVARSARSCATARAPAPCATRAGLAPLALWCVHFPCGRKNQVLRNALRYAPFRNAQNWLSCEMPA